MLILAAISITMLTGDNSILKRAVDAKERTGIAEIEEKIKLSYNAALAEDLTTGKGKLQEDTLRKELAKEFPNSTIDIDTETDTTGKKWYVKIDNGTPIEVQAGKTGAKVAELPKAAGTIPYYPSEDFTMSTEPSEQTIEGGLVITDGENEFVWVVVPMTDGNSGVYKTAGLGITDFSDANCLKIAKDLAVYSGSTLSQNPEKLSDHLPPADKVGTDYTTAYKNMLKSVYQNGGFWVGRYETGIKGTEEKDTSARDFGTDYNTERETKDDKAVISKGVQPYTWVRWGQAQTLAQGISSGTRTSSLLIGVQWDLVLKFLDKNGETDSHEWGNYADSSFTMESGKYIKYVTGYKLDTEWIDYDNTAKDNNDYLVNKVKKATPSSSEYIKGRVLYTTGANTTNNSKKNICDVAGNVYEWTIENTSSTRYPCAVRGGSFDYTGSSIPASNRSINYTSYSYYNHGFRVSLY